MSPPRSFLKPEWATLGALALALLLAGPCRREPSLPPLPPEAVVLAFGDSLTAGTGAEPHEAYPAVLQRLLHRTVLNAGIPGERAREGLARLPDLVESVNPSLVILCHGGNDILQRASADEIADPLDRMIRLLRAKHIAVLLVGVPEPTLLHRPPRLYRDLARRHGLPYEGKILSRIIARRDLKSDPVHPNAKGYREMAEALAARIQAP